MASLKEKFSQTPQDELSDIEDMSFAHLILKVGVAIWDLKDLGGKEVIVGTVYADDPDHVVTVDGLGIKLRFGNDEDVYE